MSDGYFFDIPSAPVTRVGASLDDVSRASALLIAVAGDVCDLHYLVMEGDPASKARPRFDRRGHAYTSAESRAVENRTSTYLRRFFPEPMTGNVALACIFYRPNRQRIDADNMLKHVCDAANRIIWHDDSQVTAIVGIVELDAVRPRTLIAVAPHETTMTRGTDATRPCEFCGKPVSIIGSSKRFCNLACKTGSRGLVELIACGNCGEPFRRKAHTQKYCGEECGNVAKRRPRPTMQVERPCQDCGKRVSKTGYERCRECWKLSRTAGTS